MSASDADRWTGLQRLVSEHDDLANPLPIALAAELVEPRRVAIVGDEEEIRTWIARHGWQYLASQRQAIIGDSRVVVVSIDNLAQLRGPTFDRCIVIGAASERVGRAVDLAIMATRGSPGDVFWWNPETKGCTRWDR